MNCLRFAVCVRNIVALRLRCTFIVVPVVTPHRCCRGTPRIYLSFAEHTHFVHGRFVTFCRLFLLLSRLPFVSFASSLVCVVVSLVLHSFALRLHIAPRCDVCVFVLHVSHRAHARVL